MTEVVLTGVGLVCPAGFTLETALKARFPLPISEDLDRYPAHPQLPNVLPVPDGFTLKGIVKKRKDIKLMARANQFAVAASDEAIKDAGLAEAHLMTAGLFMAVGREPSDLKALIPSVMHSVRDHELDLDTLFSEGLHWINPLSSLKTLPNMSLAHTAIHLGCRGPNMTLFGTQAFEQAIESARDAIASQKCQVAIVGAADSCTSFYDRLGVAREGLGTVVGEGAALFVLESKAHFQARNGQHHYPMAQFLSPSKTTHFGYSGAATLAMAVALHCAPHRTKAMNIISSVVRDAPLERRQVVVSGVGLVSPLGSTFTAFRQSIRDGLSGVAPISHFDATQFVVKNACEVQDDNWWSRLPPQLRSKLETVNERSANFAVSAALEALRDAQFSEVPDAILYGTGLSSVSVEELAQDCLPYLTGATPALDFENVRVFDDQTEFVSPHRHRMTLPLEILLQEWGATVEHYVHFSACAAGAAAIGHGMELIRSGAKDLVLVGASDAMIHPYGLIPFAKLGATSTEIEPRSAARPFDKERSGFVMGETAAFYVLESAAHAEARGCRQYATVHGWGSSCDAHNVTAPHPEGLGALVSMQNALEDAQLTAADIQYINAHGTGTQLNDTTEAMAIKQLFGSNQPWVSSSKSQFGHCIGAAGAIEFAVCLTALLDQFVPANISLLDPEPNLGIRLAPRQKTPVELKCVMSNSFGFGGQNVSLIVGSTQER